MKHNHPLLSKQHKTVLTLITGLILFCLTTISKAALMDFESLKKTQTSQVGSVYLEDGFRLESLTRNMPFTSFGTSDSRFVESTALFSNISNGLIRLTRADNGLFDMMSIRLAELNSLGGNVTFSGLLSNGNTVSQQVQLDGNKGFQTFTLSSQFVGLSQITWLQTSPYHQFDDILVQNHQSPQATPLPPSGLLFASMLLSYVGWVSKKRQTQALLFHQTVR